MDKPNILYIMCDQFRFDCIGELGNSVIKTPNIDRLVKRGRSYTNAYSSCPVCVPARYSVRTGCEAYTLGCFGNESPNPTYTDGKNGVEDYCGDYLARRMGKLGYRTFGIGKFHTEPDAYEDLGYDVHIHTEELYNNSLIKSKDHYAQFIAKEHPDFAHLEQLHGERTNMYYVPQMSPMSKEVTVEGFVTTHAIKQINAVDDRPYFGFVSFVGPHPPCAPPIPYNRMYDPDGMQNPIKGNTYTDSMDEQIGWMNYLIYADDINDNWTRNFKTRYYGEISYIDECIGKILDVVESNGDPDNTLICFFADHGDMIGDHGAWQKECFFEQSVKIPFILSYPKKIKPNERCDDLVSLTDLFGIATCVAGAPDARDGVLLLNDEKRGILFSFYGRPGTPLFKAMVRKDSYKYIFMSNGDREQLFDLANDPYELINLTGEQVELCEHFRDVLLKKCCNEQGLSGAVLDNKLLTTEYKPRKLQRFHQFDLSAGIIDFGVPSGCGFMREI